MKKKKTGVSLLFIFGYYLVSHQATCHGMILRQDVKNMTALCQPLCCCNLYLAGSVSTPRGHLNIVMGTLNMERSKPGLQRRGKASGLMWIIGPLPKFTA